MLSRRSDRIAWISSLKKNQDHDHCETSCSSVIDPSFLSSWLGWPNIEHIKHYFYCIKEKISIEK